MRPSFLPLAGALAFAACGDPAPSTAPGSSAGVVKPSGVFASAGALSPGVVGNAANRGVLIRAYWKELEATEGSYAFDVVDRQVSAVRSAGKKYALAILAGGIGSPDWLIGGRGARYVDHVFRSQSYRLPLMWDSVSLHHMSRLASALGERYGSDTSLALVYVTQMTVNGIEGHLNGIDQATFTAAGYTEDRWVHASLRNVKAFATAFPRKALAIEVHELFGSAAPAERIITEAWSDASLGHRVGAGMWWISGNSTYQPSLLAVLKRFEGDIYCQAIDRSDNAASFPSGDYTRMFAQAVELRARYLEAWDVEFTTTKWDRVFEEFNRYADGLRK